MASPHIDRADIDESIPTDRLQAERVRLSEVVGFTVCGHHDGGLRSDGAPSLCLLERNHPGDHVPIEF